MYPRERHNHIVETEKEMSAAAKIYIGDGVYAAWHPGEQQIALTTENGVAVTNIIYLEPEVMESLARFWERIKESPLK